MQKASLPGCPSTNFSNSYGFFPPFHYGQWVVWPHSPLAEPSPGPQARNSYGRVYSYSRKHKDDPENAPCSSAGSGGFAPLSTAHARNQARQRSRPARASTVTGRTGLSLLAGRGGGAGERLGALPGKQPSDLWLPLWCGKKAEQQKFRPGSEPTVKSNNYNKLIFYILISF